MTDDPPPPPPPPPDHERLRAETAQDLRTRLRPMCADWPEEAFEAMIQEMATLAVRTERTSEPYDRRTTDRLIADMNALLERNAEARRRKE